MNSLEFMQNNIQFFIKYDTVLLSKFEIYAYFIDKEFATYKYLEVRTYKKGFHRTISIRLLQIMISK